MKKVSIILSMSILSLLSCNSNLDATFWVGFKKSFLVKNVSNQGPQGGHAAMYWKTDGTEKFSESEILSYAKKNGWLFIKDLSITKDQIDKWRFNNNPIFPLSNEGFDEEVTINNSVYRKFPRWIDKDLKVLTFKTGSVAIEPGTNESQDINGFVVISNDYTEMSVYHIWGE